MIAYLAVFVIILLIITLSKRDERSDKGIFGGSLVSHFLIRLIFDSIYWTLHPFSPFVYRQNNRLSLSNKNLDKKNIKFYEKVNQFVFGIEKPQKDKLFLNKKLLQHIQINNGYTNIYDIIKITSLSKNKIQGILAKFVIDYNGKILIDKNGTVLYFFPELAFNTKNAISLNKKIIAPIWSTKKHIPPFTGNSWKINFLIGGMNGFNLLVSAFVIKNDLTLNKIKYILSSTSFSNFDSLFIDNIYNNTPILFGWIPFIFSTILFSIPLTRFLFRKKLIKKINHANGYKGLIKSLSSHIDNNKLNISETLLMKEWKLFCGKDIDPKLLSKIIIKLGGEMDINNEGQVFYKFNNLLNEFKALKSKMKILDSKKSKIHDKIIFSSED